MRVRAFVIGGLFAAVFAYLAMVACNRGGAVLPATQISSLAVLFCLFLAVALNPLCRLLRLPPLDRREILLVFIMGSVPAGLPVYGFVCQAIPLAAGLHNPDWSTPQSEWDARIEPNVDPGLFIGAPLFAEREVPDWPRFAARLAEKDLPAVRLREALPDAVREALSRAIGGAAPSGAERVEIAESLRHVLSQAGLFDAKTLEGLALPEEGRSLLERAPATLLPEETARLNRMVFETLFAGRIRPGPFLASQKACLDYARGLRSRGGEAWPAFLKKDDESLRQFTSRFVSAVRGGKGAGQNVQAPFFGDVPWQAWIPPLLRWTLVAGVVLMLFYALNELVFRQWHEREKLIFPIAELSSTILSPPEDGKGSLPPIFRQPLFWFGFSVAFFVLLYNGLLEARWIEGLNPIDLSCRINNQLRGTMFAGLNPHFRTEIFFACIGLAFLLPPDVSFSIWFFYLFMIAQQLIAVWFGYGVDAQSFPENWLDQASFMSAQGGGAMEVFGLVCLWRVRRPLLALVYRLAEIGKPKGKWTAPEEIRAQTIPSALFFLASAGVIYLLREGGVSWGLCVVTYVSWLLLTVSMVRLVAECGLLSFHMHFGPVHIVKALGLLKFPALFAYKGLATVILLSAVFFVDLKTFVAPTMMNARYLAEKNGIRARPFALALLLGVAITVTISYAVALVLAYDQGVNAMEPWFFRQNPDLTFQIIKNTMAGAARATPPADFSTAAWAGLGAALCGGLLWARRIFAWVPHPIGYLMFANPLMAAYWFSFLLGWICKRAAIRYCDAGQYEQARAAFIGLIMGEVAAVALSLFLALCGYPNMGLSLDR